MISEKAAWEKDFISTYKDQSDTDKLAEAYKQIQSLIESYKKDLPTEVGVELNANAILNKVLAGAPSKFDDNLINQGAYQDVQFFIDQVKTQKLDDSNLKQFQDMSKEMEERSQKLVVLQSLDSLYNIPKTYEETIGAANKDLGKQLVQKVIQDGFMPVGDLLIRQTVGPDGQPQQQILPNYTIYGYEGPKQLPKVKDSDGKEWDLSNFNALAADGGPSTAELQQMVKLAISVLDKDFKKTYDPVNQENREEKIAALDPVAMAKVMQASQGALRSLLSDPQYMAASASDKKYMEQNAMSSGYLVGPTEGGVFGDWHFNQFYTSLKLKEKYDSLEAKGKELNSDGFSNAVGSAVQLYTQGAIYGLGAMAALATGPWAIYLAPKIMEVTQNAVDQTKNIKSDTANFMHENKDTIDAAAAIAAVVTGPVGRMIAFAAYKATQGAFEGGALGFVAGAANIGNAYLQGMTGGSLSYEMSYSYKDGFGVSVGGGYGEKGLGIGGSISWNANTNAISGSVGLQTRIAGNDRITGTLGMNFDNSGFTGVNAGIGIGLGTKTEGSYGGSLNFGLSYDRNDGFGQSAGISQSPNQKISQMGIDYSHTAFGGDTWTASTPAYMGVNASYSYNNLTHGYTGTVNANGATALTYDSISGTSTYNNNFFGDVGKNKAMSIGGMTDEEYKKFENDQKAIRAQSQGLWEGTLGIVGSAWDGLKTAWNATVDGLIKVGDAIGDAWFDRKVTNETTAELKKLEAGFQDAAKITQVGQQAKEIVAILADPDKRAELALKLKNIALSNAEAKGLDGIGEGLDVLLNDPKGKLELAKFVAAYKADIMSDGAYINFDSTELGEQEKIKAMKEVLKTIGQERIGKEQMEKMGIPKTVIDSFNNEKSGFHAELFRDTKTGQYTLAFRGTEMDSLSDLGTDAGNAARIKTSQYGEAASLAQALSNTSIGYNINFTGHSLGGGLATVAASVLPKSSAITFNSAGVSESVISNLDGSINGLDKRITAYSLQGDILTNTQSSALAGPINSYLETINDAFGTNFKYNTLLPQSIGTPVSVVPYIGNNEVSWWQQQSLTTQVQLHSNNVMLNSFYQMARPTRNAR